ncbi:MAG: hypothetical protein GX126_08050 [Bacteroidales bacterium]|nr:hypothetical protein [Bacteroidales bacterium]
MAKEVYSNLLLYFKMYSVCLLPGKPGIQKNPKKEILFYKVLSLLKIGLWVEFIFSENWFWRKEKLQPDLRKFGMNYPLLEPIMNH